jgi:hypothetical protein
VTFLQRAAVFSALVVTLGSCFFRPSTHNAQAVVQSADTSVAAIHSGDLLLRLEVAGAQTPLSGFEMKGPFRIPSPGALLAHLDMTQFDGARKQSATFVSTGTRTYVSRDGTTTPLNGQEVTRVLSSAQRIDLGTLIKGRRTVKAGGLVGTTTTNEVSGDLDAPTALPRFVALARTLGIGAAARLPQTTTTQRTALDPAVKAATIDIWTGRDDGRLRKVSFDIEFKEDRSLLPAQLANLAGLTLHLEAAVQHLNESVSIPTPAAFAPHVVRFV